MDHVDLEVRVWKLRLGLAKCFVIVFALIVPHPLPIYIGDVALRRVEKGKYLGLVLNSTFTWDDHVEFVLARTGASLKTIATHVATTAPRWSVVVQLVRALVLPRISYGMPVFAPTAAQSAKLATAVARGLYRMLGVVGNPASMPVIVDNGLLSPEHEVKLAALRYANRLWKARTARNPASDTLMHQLQSPALPLAAGQVYSVARLVRKAEADLDASFAGEKLQSKDALEVSQRQQRQKAAAPRAGNSEDEKARKAMMPREGHAQYLHSLSRKDIATVAPFRYNRIGLNHVLQLRGAAASADCPFCAGVTETLGHALLDCPQYAAARAQCFGALRALNAPTNYSVLLGAVETLQEDRRKPVLDLVVKYLYKIREVRRV
jgi:hypothetical protein